MGKLKDAYNKCKPTDRQIKKQNKSYCYYSLYNIVYKLFNTF